jgi:hypothetical protein
MPAKDALKASTRQAAKFIKTAREHGADESEAATERTMKRLAETKPTKHAPTK